ncbi:MAG: DUF1508 domain-containing protein [Clostridia bacterium]|nr:DUF1508 domain-containing protein [Clostridia bacterium]
MGLFSIFKKNKKAEEIKAAPKAEATNSREVQKTEAPTEAPKTEIKKEAVAAKSESKAVTKPKSEPKKPTAPKSQPTTKSDSQKKPAATPTAPAIVSEEKPKKASPVGKFEIKKSKDDRYVFNLYAANKVIVATSQVYSSSTAAMNGIKSVIENAVKAPVEDQTLKAFDTLPYPKWEIYQDKGGQYRFRLNASNGSCICHSQGYTSKASCKNGIESIKKTAKDAVIDKSYLKKD